MLGLGEQPLAVALTDKTSLGRRPRSSLATISGARLLAARVSSSDFGLGGRRVGPDHRFSWVMSLPRTGRAASASAPACGRSGATGRRCAALRSTRPRQSCAAAMRCLEFLPPTAVLPSTSPRRRNGGARAPTSGALLGRSTRSEPAAPRRNDHGHRGRSNVSPALRDRYRANW